jgi:hypothetical protein
MPIYTISAPNGRTYSISGPPGASQQDVISAVIAQYPEAARPAPAPIGGVRGALGAATESAGSDLVTGIQALIGNANEAAVAARKREEDIGQRYDTASSFEKISKAYNAPGGGLFSAARTALSEVPNVAAGMAPALAEMGGLPLVGGMVAGPVGGAIGAGLGLGAQYLQSIGAGVTSQAAEQQKQGEPVDVNVGRAAAFAVPETALNYLHLAPLGAKTVASVFGPKVAGLLERGAVTEAEKAAQEKLANQGFWKTLGKGTAEGAAINTPLMVAQTALSRAQAGQDLFSDDALAAYGSAATSGALSGPLGAVGSFQERGAARDAVATRNTLADIEAQKTKAAQDAAEQQQRLADPNYPQQVAQQYSDLQQQYNDLKAAKSVKVAEDDFAGQEAKKEARTAFSEFLNKPENKDIIAEYKRVQEAGLLAPKAPEQAPAAQAALFPAAETPVPTKPETDLRGQPLQRVAPEVPATDPVEDVKYLTGQIENLQKTAVNVTEPAKYNELTQQYSELTKALAEAQARADALPNADALAKKLAYAQEQFRVAREQGDMSKANSYAQKVQELLNQGAGQTRIPDKLNKKLYGSESTSAFNVRTSAEEMAQRQADLIAQNEGVPPTPPEGAPNVTSYLRTLDQLDELRKQGFTEAQIAALERRHIDTSRTDQGLLFPEERDSVINTGAGKQPEKTRAQLLSELQAARQTRDRAGVNTAIEQLRVYNKLSKARSDAAKGINQPTGTRTDAETAKQLAGTGLTATGTQPTTFERSFTRKTVTPEELRAQIASMPENLPAHVKQLLSRVLDNFGDFAKNKDRANMLADWLYKTKTAQVHPDVITAPDVFRERALKNELDKLDYAKRQKQPGLFSQEQAPMTLSKAEQEALAKRPAVERPVTQTDREAADAAKRKAENERAERLANIPGESVSFEARRRAFETLGIGSRKKLKDLRAKAADESLPKTTRDKANREIKKLENAKKYLAASMGQDQSGRLQAEEDLSKLKDKIKHQEEMVQENPISSRKKELAKSKRREKELNAILSKFKMMAERTPIETNQTRAKANAEAMAREFLERHDTLEQEGTLGALPARDIGPVVRKTVSAGDVRTGTLETVGERTLGGSNPPRQAGKPRSETVKAAVEAANKAAAEKIAARAPLTEEEISRLDLAQHMQMFEAAQRMRLGLERNLADMQAKIDFSEKSTNAKLKDPNYRDELRVSKESIERDLAKARANEDALGGLYEGGERAKPLEGVDPTTLAHEDVRFAIRDGNTLSAVDGLIKHGSTPEVRKLATRLREFLDGVKTSVQQDLRDASGKEVAGLYKGARNEVVMNPDRLTEEDILHELTHAATVEVLNTDDAKLTPAQRAAKKGIVDMYKSLKDRTEVKAYGLKDEFEFVSEVNSNPEFRNFMDSLGKPKTLLNRIKDFFVKLLRLDRTPTDSEQALKLIDQIYMPARAHFEGRNMAKEVRYAPGLSTAGKLANEVVAGEQSLTERYNAMSFGRGGLEFMTKMVDQFAPLARASKLMDSLAGTQMMHDLRMVGQRMNALGQVLGHGPLERVEITRADGKKEWIYQARNGANLVDVNKLLASANKITGSSPATNNLFSLYSIAKRAERVGLDRLNYDKTITADKLKQAMDEIKAVPGLEKIFDAAHSKYQEFNRGLIDFAVKTRFLSKADAAKMNSSADYIPYYRENAQGEVSLMMGKEEITRIGNIKGQPYLHELVGGNQRILDFNTAAVRNANMLLEMSLRNQAALGAAYNLRDVGMAQVGKGKGSGPDMFNFKQDGADMHARVLSTADIPAELLVKGMEGIPVQTSSLLNLMGMPSRLARQMFVANPVSAARILFKDTLSSAMTAGSNLDSIGAAFKNVGDNLMERRGIAGGEVFQGTSADMANILREVQSGKPGWETLLAKAHVLHAKADAMTRQIRYESYLKQGRSEMEASYMALESMNFTKRGISPSIHVLNTLNPFINSQIQGINTLVQALRGNMPFNEQLKIREKIFQRGMLVAGGTMLYSALMQDDPTYKNAKPDQKYNNWFVNFPGVEEMVRVPIMFEAGILFKAVPEALVNMMYGRNEDAAEGLKQAVQKMIPGGDTLGIPLALRPAIETGLGKSFYTGRDLESRHEQTLQPGERTRPGTSAFADALGSELGVSPIKIDHLIQGYTGGLGAAVMHMASALALGKQGEDRAPETKLSERPFIGSTFQPKDAGAIVDEAYKQMNELSQVAATYKDKLTKDPAAAAAYRDRYLEEIGKEKVAPAFAQTMSAFNKQRQAVLNSQMTPVEKRAWLEDWTARRTAYAQQALDAARASAHP